MAKSNKYPRTSHLPWSPSPTEDDKRMRTVKSLLNREVVVLEKLDGGNMTLTRDCVYARSHAGPPVHPYFSMAKQVHAGVRHLIPEGQSVFCEYLFAVHSIVYEALPAYLVVIGVRDDETGEWAAWDRVVEVAKELSLPSAPVLFRGTFKDAKELEALTTAEGKKPSVYGGDREGTVTRWTEGFGTEDFRLAVGKWVREGHVKTNAHWWLQAPQKQVLANNQSQDAMEGEGHD